MKKRKDKTGLKVGDKLLVSGEYSEVVYTDEYGGVDIRMFGVKHNDPLSYYGDNWFKIKTIVTE
jgi:hypothetical protein